MELKDLVGKHVLSGVDRIRGYIVSYGSPEEADGIRFCLDDINYECLENPKDGYRSFLEDLKVTSEPCRYRFPETEVLCSMSEDRYRDEDILEVRETKTGKIVLRIGTDNDDFYYPVCIMQYFPQALPCNAGVKEDE